MRRISAPPASQVANPVSDDAHHRNMPLYSPVFTGGWRSSFSTEKMIIQRSCGIEHTINLTQLMNAVTILNRIQLYNLFV